MIKQLNNYFPMNISKYSCSLRLYSSKINLTEKLSGWAQAQKKVVKKIKSSESKSTVKLSRDIQSYFKDINKNSILPLIPEKFLKRTKRIADQLYLTDEDVAEIIFNEINKHCSTSTIVEVNPGIGLLTKKLMTKPLSQLILYESNEEMYKNLDENIVQASSQDNILLKKGDFLNMWKLAYQDKLDNKDRLPTLLNELPKKIWKEGAIEL